MTLRHEQLAVGVFSEVSHGRLVAAAVNLRSPNAYRAEELLQAKYGPHTFEVLRVVSSVAFLHAFPQEAPQRSL